MSYIQPFKGPLQDFPDSNELPEGVKTITLSYTFFKNDTLTSELAAGPAHAAGSRAAP